jgi:hypothetical protein
MRQEPRLATVTEPYVTSKDDGRRMKSKDSTPSASFVQPI